MNDIGGHSSDAGMIRVMGMVGVALLLLAIFIGLTANFFGDDDEGVEGDALMRNALIGRIEPVGQVRTSADDLPASATVVADAGGAMRSGEELVNGVCAGCHLAGVGGAPLLADEAVWAERRAQGLATLVATVISGKGAMPPRGGSDYSDEEIERAVKHIALFEPDPADAAGEGAVAAPAADPAAAPAPAPAAAPAAAPMVVGQAPADLPDHVKTTVDGVCAGCHIAGVAGAPKIGDQPAWQERADKGLAALVATVTNGMGAMPARGGSNLSDEEIPVAIQYLMSK